MFFVRLLEEREIISLFSITVLASVTLAYCVHCAVQTELLIIIQVYKIGLPVCVLNQTTSTLPCNTRHLDHIKLLLLSVGLPVANAPDVLQPCGLFYYP